MWSTHVNMWAVLVAAISTMVVGGIWYSPFLFGNVWMKVIGMDPNDKVKMKEMQRSTGPLYTYTFAGSLIMAYVLAIFLWSFNAVTLQQGIGIAFVIWLGFIFTIKISDAAFSGRSRKQSLDMFWTSAGYQLVSMIVMAVILVLWK